MLCDFHTHLHQYDEGDTALGQIAARGIITVASSMDFESYEKTRRMAALSGLIVPTFGIHPARAGKIACGGAGRSGVGAADASALAADPRWDAYLRESPIIGEIGLDLLWWKDVAYKDQLAAFEAFLDHCHRERKYCVLHTKGAERETLEVLANYPGARPIIHWYNGPEREFLEITRRGYYCTFGCELKRSACLQDLLRRTPRERVLAETDNPESERWLGGERRDPLLIESVVADIAAALGMSPESANELVMENSLRVLGEAGALK